MSSHGHPGTCEDPYKYQYSCGKSAVFCDLWSSHSFLSMIGSKKHVCSWERIQCRAICDWWAQSHWQSLWAYWSSVATFRLEIERSPQSKWSKASCGKIYNENVPSFQGERSHPMCSRKVDHESPNHLYRAITTMKRILARQNGKGRNATRRRY